MNAHAVWIGLGLQYDDKKVILLTTHTDRTKCVSSTKRLLFKHKVEDYTVLDLTSPNFEWRFTAWLLDKGFYLDEAREILRGLAINLIKITVKD